MNRRYETTDLSLGHAEALEVEPDGTCRLLGNTAGEVSREWAGWYLRQVRARGRSYPGRYATVRTTGASLTPRAAAATTSASPATSRPGGRLRLG